MVQHRNLDHTGQDPDPQARDWTRSESHYFYGRLLEALVDRAPLDRPEDLQDPLGTALQGDDRYLAWMARYAFSYRDDGQILEVELPNGSTNRYEIDGYGTLYRIIADFGGENVELGRSYYDDDLVLARRSRLLESGPPEEYATWVYARNHNGQGWIDRVLTPTGLQEVVTLDELGRPVHVVQQDSASNPLAALWTDATRPAECSSPGGCSTMRKGR
ncbi:MAG: hypothetical protein IPM29_32775 [Planctomycetes bacterium]|nr:hypothetical protein [Planctomycetota bacterium]